MPALRFSAGKNCIQRGKKSSLAVLGRSTVSSSKADNRTKAATVSGWCSLGLCVVSLHCGGSPDITVTAGFEETIVDNRIQRISGMALLDYDGDGDQDIAVTATGNGAVFLYDNLDGTGSQWARLSLSGQDALAASQIEIFDVENDGDPDIFVAASEPLRTEAAGEITWYENVGGPNPFRPRILTGPRWVGATSLKAGDITGDGLLDLVVTSTQPRYTALSGHGISYFENVLDDFDGPFPIDNTLMEAESVHLADIDGDGDADLLGSTGLDRQFIFYENLDGRSFSRRVLFTRVRASDVRWTDIESDGDLEGIVAFTHTTSTSIQRIEPAVIPTRTWNSTELYGWLQLGVGTDAKFDLGDFDGDDRTDIVVSTSAGTLDVLTQTSTSGFRRTPVRLGYRGLTDVKANDFDRDGRLDFLTVTSGFASRDRLALWRNVSFEPL